MDLREDAHRMAAFRQGTGFGDMIAFFIDAFCIGAFRTIPDNAESFKVPSVRLCDIGIIDKDDRLGRGHGAYEGEVRFKCRFRGTLIEMSGEAVNRVDLFSLFVKAVYDISEKTAVGSKDAIGYIGSKLFIRFRKLFRSFIGKR